MKRRGRQPLLGPEYVDEVRRLTAAGWTDKRLAERFGCKLHNIRDFRRRHNIGKRRGGMKKAWKLEQWSKKPTPPPTPTGSYQEDGRTIHRFPPAYARGVEPWNTGNGYSAKPTRKRRMRE